MRIYNTINDISRPEGPVCIALGLFDGLHLGHMSVIGAAVKSAGEHGFSPCVFTFSTDSLTPRGKTPSRLISLEAFFRILEETGVEHIFRPSFSEIKDIEPRDFAAILKDRLGADRIFCGADFRFGRNAAATASDLSGYGAAQVNILPMMEIEGAPISSSAIRSYIRDGDVVTASHMLGRRFFIDFEIVKGRKLGRVLGSPTINQPFPTGFTIPRFGVYATAALVNGTLLSAVTNVGIKPTVGSDHILAETYIHGFSGDLYGERVRVEFLRFIRPEVKFPDIEALRAQILADSAEAAAIAEDMGIKPLS